MKTVLVVEDDANLRRIVRALLEREGFLVREAEDGQQGLESALAASPDCIVTDAMMPRLGGLEMLLALRERCPDRAVPALFVTAASQVPEPAEQARAGIVGVVTKPFDFDRLVAAVRRAAG